MNIYYLDTNPIICARYLHDAHITKMIDNSVELLSAWALFNFEERPSGPLWIVNPNNKHPCALWLCDGPGNVKWLLEHLNALLFEYKFRFNKQCAIAESYLDLHEYFNEFVFVKYTVPKGCFPDVYKNGIHKTEDILWGYRRYYVAEELPQASYTKREFPNWGDPPQKEKPIDLSTITIPKKEKICPLSITLPTKTSQTHSKLSAASIKIK